MNEEKCNFSCCYLDEFGECEEIGGECVGDMCERWNDCGACERSEECKDQ